MFANICIRAVMRAAWYSVLLNSLAYMLQWHGVARSTLVISFADSCGCVPMRAAWYSVFLNSLVHVFMYAYYFAATALGANPAARRRYLWWGCYLTQFQVRGLPRLRVPVVGPLHNPVVGPLPHPVPGAGLAAPEGPCGGGRSITLWWGRYLTQFQVCGLPRLRVPVVGPLPNPVVGPLPHPGPGAGSAALMAPLNMFCLHAGWQGVSTPCLFQHRTLPPLHCSVKAEGCRDAEKAPILCIEDSFRLHLG